MAQFATWFSAIPMATFDTSGLTGTYQALNGAGFGDTVKMLKIYNASDTGITISYDGGTTDHDFIPPVSTFILDIQANHAASTVYASGTLNGKNGQIIMGKGSAGTGNLYIAGYR